MRVFITGIGMISALGMTADENWQNILAGKSSVEFIPEDWHDYMDFRSKIWSPLPDINFLEQGFNRAELIQNDPVTLISILSTTEAIKNAGLAIELVDKKRNRFHLPQINSERCSAIYGTGVGGAGSFLSNYGYHMAARPKKNLATLLDNQPEALKVLNQIKHSRSYNPFAIPMAICNSTPAGIGIKYSIHGDVKPVVQACASGTTAIGEAFNKIRYGHADMVLSGGAEYSNDHCGAGMYGFDVSRTLALIPENGIIQSANRPFDANRSGFLFAQGGAASLILESEQHLHDRGGEPIAEIVGFAETFDAHSVLAPHVDGVQIERMIRNAIHDAGIQPDDIDYINAHGTGTPTNDAVESSVLERVIGLNTPINSTKSILGHTLGASGAIEAAVCALSLRDQVLHSSINIDQPISDLDFVFENRELKLEYVLSESFAFGGHNSGIIMKRV